MKNIIGIDEVGRGPLAGPVTIGIVSCDIKTYSLLKRNKNLPAIGKDSKKLSSLAREKYTKNLQSLIQGLPLDKMNFSIIHVSNRIIDKSGISFAIRKAIRTGLEKLKLDPSKCKVLLDGGLKAPIDFKQKTIIKGDEKEKIIAWASILAKVSRDKLMCNLSKKYPLYGLEKHKGYGTLEHKRAIKKHGLSEIHRKSFCKQMSKVPFDI